MAQSYDVVVTVKSQKGHCGWGHNEDCWKITGTTPSGMCLAAFAAILPAVRTYMMGGVHPWEKDEDATDLCCQDALNPVVFEIRRVPKE
ncbi:MAG: TIGR04076 family protein [Bacillota bacterium]|nr:TIGR04076 family protein [Bacillota bacterium]